MAIFPTLGAKKQGESEPTSNAAAHHWPDDAMIVSVIRRGLSPMKETGYFWLTEDVNLVSLNTKDAVSACD